MKEKMTVTGNWHVAHILSELVEFTTGKKILFFCMKIHNELNILISLKLIFFLLNNKVRGTPESVNLFRCKFCLVLDVGRKGSIIEYSFQTDHGNKSSYG
jgi:hypothetical protein